MSGSDRRRVPRRRRLLAFVAVLSVLGLLGVLVAIFLPQPSRDDGCRSIAAFGAFFTDSRRVAADVPELVRRLEELERTVPSKRVSGSARDVIEDIEAERSSLAATRDWDGVNEILTERTRLGELIDETYPWRNANCALHPQPSSVPLRK